MKKLLLIIIIIALAGGCSRRYCERHYPPKEVENTKYIETIKLDTTYLQMPADTTYIELPFDCPDQQIIYREGKKETKIVVKDKVIHVSSITAADSAAIISLYKESKDYKDQTKIVEVKYIPKWAIWLKWIFIGLFLAGAGYWLYRSKWLWKIVFKGI